MDLRGAAPDRVLPSPLAPRMKTDKPDANPDADFDAVLRAAAALQRVLPDAVLVGGTAAAVHAGHRLSGDADHTLDDLRNRFDAVLDLLDAHPDWREARRAPGVLLLGNFLGVPTGVRQLRRKVPLETVVVRAPDGAPLRVPTLAETLRVKAWLALTRNYGRDYIDTAALADALGGEKAARALLSFDECYAECGGWKPNPPGEKSPLRQLLRQLADPRPAARKKATPPGGATAGMIALRPPWNDWEHVRARCLDLATAVTEGLTAQAAAPRPESHSSGQGPAF